MCYDLVTVLACGCSHIGGVEYCQDAIFGNQGKECPPEKRTSRQRTQPGDARADRTCGKDPCPTQLAIQQAKEHDDKLKQARDEVAMEYERGERTPGGGKSMKKSPSTTRTIKDKGQPLLADDPEENEDAGFYSDCAGTSNLGSGATSGNKKDHGKNKEKSCEEPTSREPPSADKSKAGRGSPPPAHPRTSANPPPRQETESFDFGIGFNFDSIFSDVDIGVGTDLGGVERTFEWEEREQADAVQAQKSETSVAHNQQQCPGWKGLQSQLGKNNPLQETKKHVEMNKNSSLIDELKRLDLAQKRYERERDMRLSNTYDDEDFWMTPGKNETTSAKQVDHSLESAPTGNNARDQNRQAAGIETVAHQATKGRTFAYGDSDTTPKTPTPKRSSQFWPSGNSRSGGSSSRKGENSDQRKSTVGARKSWMSTFGAASPSPSQSPSAYRYRTPKTGSVVPSACESVFGSSSPGSHTRRTAAQTSTSRGTIALGNSPGAGDSPVAPIPPPVYALPSRQGQGHDIGLAEGAESTLTSSPHATTGNGSDWSASPITTPSKAVVRGEARNLH